jgi:hypothetical protein
LALDADNEYATIDSTIVRAQLHSAGLTLVHRVWGCGQAGD